MPSAKIDGFSENFLDGSWRPEQVSSDLPQLVCGLSRGARGRLPPQDRILVRSWSQYPSERPTASLTRAEFGNTKMRSLTP
jgi:hypothetical protein